MLGDVATIRRRPRLVGFLLAFALLAVAACGQKPGVHVAATGGGQLGGGELGGGELGGGELAGGDLSSGDGSAGSAEGGSTAEGGAGGGGAAGGGAGGGGGGAAAGGGSQKPTGSDRTGAGPDALVVAVHAPVTGAAPLPSTSFEEAADLYWRRIIEIDKGDVLGRKKVEVLFKDDKYQPNTAVQACRELAARAFLLVGGGGTDQIQACGRFASQARVPYLSAGVTEAGLRDLPWYFATSMSYKQQGPLLAQYVAKNFGGKKVAMIVTDTPNFDDAVDGWEGSLSKNGINYYKTLRHAKGDNSWYTQFGSELRSNGVEVVYMLTAPVDYIRFAQQNSGAFQFVGVGITQGLNAVLESGCPHVDNGQFFSPSPGLDWAAQNEPEFFDTAQKLGAPADDIGLLLWGNAKVQHEMLKRYQGIFGNDLTREDFRAMLEQQQNIKTDMFGPLSYSPTDHFGGSQVHVLRASCADEQYKTIHSFVTGF
jgi:ABC-type branched-subunit amino acid transport system substrate-binding protein